jgi:hypothetical protein
MTITIRAASAICLFVCQRLTPSVTMPAAEDGVQAELYSTEPALAGRPGCILLAQPKVSPKVLWGAIADGNYAADTVLLMESPRYSHMELTGSVRPDIPWQTKDKKVYENGHPIRPVSKAVLEGR